MMWVLSISIISLSACKRNHISKSTSETQIDTIAVITDSTKVDSAVAIKNEVTEVKVNDVAFKYLTTKSKFSIESKKQNQDNVNISIRIQKDSLIWLSVTGVGFELGRGLISRDSIVFMDKFHKDYYVFSYAELSNRFNFDLSFELLQSIIIGNLPYPITENDSLGKKDNMFWVKQNKAPILLENFIGEDNLKLLKLNGSQLGTVNTFSLDYSDFRPVNDALFPFIGLVNVHGKSAKTQEESDTKVTLKHTKVEILNQSPGFPFNVPSGYTRKR